jgi:hypothetical protein
VPTVILPGNSLSQTNWRAGVIVESERKCLSMAFQGDKPNNGIVVEDRPDQGGGGRGDTVIIRFTQPNHGAIPKTSLANIVGQADGTNYIDVSITMRYMSFDGGVPNVPAEQNQVSFNLKRNDVGRVARQWAELREYSVWRQLTGFTGQLVNGPGGPLLGVNSFTDYVMSAGNIVTPPDGIKPNSQAGKWYLVPPSGGGTSATETAVAANNSCVMSTRVIDEIVKRWTSRDYVEWPMAPMATPWGEKFVLVVSPQGFQQIKLNSSQSDFYDLARAAITGGEGYDSSPIITGEGFVYNDTVVLKSDFLPPGVASAGPSAPYGAGTNQANVKRAVFLGARGGHATYGSGYTGGNHLGFTDVTILRNWTFIVDSNWGVCRTVVNLGQPNAESFGCGVISHWSDV